MIPVNAVSAISLAVRPDNQAIKLQAPCLLLVDVAIETEDQNPIPYATAMEGLIVNLTIPNGKRSKVMKLEADTRPGQGAITFASGILTAAGKYDTSFCLASPKMNPVPLNNLLNWNLLSEGRPRMKRSIM